MVNLDIVVIINSFNRLSLLKESISSLFRELNKSEIKFAIVVYEAGSNDGSIEWLNDFSKKVPNQIFVIDALSDTNTSFSHGVNVACDYALKQFNNFNYFFLYETDNYLISATPVKLSKRLLEERENIAACGFTVKKYNGNNAGFGSSFPSILSFLLGQQLSFLFKLNDPKVNWNKFKDTKFSYADVVYTSPLLIKKQSWVQLHGMDEENFPFSDCDIDLANRLASTGKRMAVIESADVLHDNKLEISSWSSTRSINYYKARYHYFRKHYGAGIKFLKPFLWIMHVIELAMLSFLYILGKRNMDSLKTRLFLMKTVFNNYNLKS